jgi:hypothetical protein
MVATLHHLFQGFRLLHFTRLKGEIEKKEGECLGDKSKRNREFGGKRLNRDSQR